MFRAVWVSHMGRIDGLINYKDRPREFLRPDLIGSINYKDSPREFLRPDLKGSKLLKAV